MFSQKEILNHSIDFLKWVQSCLNLRTCNDPEKIITAFTVLALLSLLKTFFSVPDRRASSTSFVTSDAAGQRDDSNNDTSRMLTTGAASLFVCAW